MTFNFQTTIGRLLCEKAADTKVFDNFYFIVLARNSDGVQLKKQFKEEFQCENHNVNLIVLSRDQCIKMFDLKKTSNEIDLVHSILESVPRNSLIFCDEALMKTDNTQTGNDYDWSNLRNDRAAENVSLVLSFKPVVQLNTRKIIRVNIKWPDGADVVTLTRSYRQSVSLFNTVQSYHSQGVRVLNAQVNPVGVLQGPKPDVFYYDREVTADMKTFVHHQLAKYSPDQVKILFTESKSDDAEKIFKNSGFAPSLSKWTSFIGSEAPVIVMFFSDGDRNWEFMEMASRAQYKVFIVNVMF